jgi:hypothetical protein
MAKRMQDKESIAGVSWLIVLALSCWGGLVRYLIDVKQNKAAWSWVNALAQIAVSGFTGLIGGLISVESGLSLYMILVTSGISGAMGSVALTYFWERLTGIKMQISNNGIALIKSSKAASLPHIRTVSACGRSVTAGLSLLMENRSASGWRSSRKRQIAS